VDCTTALDQGEKYHRPLGGPGVTVVSLSLTLNLTYVDSAFGPITGNPGSPLGSQKIKPNFPLVKGQCHDESFRSIRLTPTFYIGNSSCSLKKLTSKLDESKFPP